MSGPRPYSPVSNTFLKCVGRVRVAVRDRPARRSTRGGRSGAARRRRGRRCRAARGPRAGGSRCAGPTSARRTPWPSSAKLGPSGCVISSGFTSAAIRPAAAVAVVAAGGGGGVPGAWSSSRSSSIALMSTAPTRPYSGRAYWLSSVVLLQPADRAHHAAAGPARACRRSTPRRRPGPGRRCRASRSPRGTAGRRASRRPRSRTRRRRWPAARPPSSSVDRAQAIAVEVDRDHAARGRGRSRSASRSPRAATAVPPSRQAW